jgi:hypothetical protein
VADPRNCMSILRLQPTRIRRVTRMVAYVAIQIRISSIEAFGVFGLPAANRWVEHSRFPRDGSEDGVAADRNVACMQARSQMFCDAPWARTDCNCLHFRALAVKWPFRRSDRIRLQHQ